ncbi:MAG: hypothetical protein ACFB0G_03390 [Leptolyngbyaceae cyanobacterium]
MTELLGQAIEQLRSLDADRQDVIATLITEELEELEELEDEEKWDAAFANSQSLCQRVIEAGIDHNLCANQDHPAD